MPYRIRQQRWRRYGRLLGLGGALWCSAYLAGQWQGLVPASLIQTAQAQEKPHEHGHEDLAPYMLRNAYHLSTLYHAGRAAQWDLAAYQAEELAENLDDAAEAAPTFAGFLRDYKKDAVLPLQQAIAARQAQRFTTAFRAAVQGCNDCHKAHKHAYIVIPEEPPNLSIFRFAPSRKPLPKRAAAPQSQAPQPHQEHQH